MSLEKSEPRSVPHTDVDLNLSVLYDKRILKNKTQTGPEPQKL